MSPSRRETSCVIVFTVARTLPKRRQDNNGHSPFFFGVTHAPRFHVRKNKRKRSHEILFLPPPPNGLSCVIKQSISVQRAFPFLFSRKVLFCLFFHSVFGHLWSNQDCETKERIVLQCGVRSYCVGMINTKTFV